MKGEHSNKCDICKSTGSETHSRIFYRKIKGCWKWICKSCWDNQENEKCMCLKCTPNKTPNRRFNVCSICGNKRCPHASDHNFECTNSNEVG